MDGSIICWFKKVRIRYPLVHKGLELLSTGSKVTLLKKILKFTNALDMDLTKLIPEIMVSIFN